MHWNHQFSDVECCELIISLKIIKSFCVCVCVYTRERERESFRRDKRYIRAILFRRFFQMQPHRALSRPFILVEHFAPSPDNVLFSRDVYFPAS